jgi:hypothetical protein
MIGPVVSTAQFWEYYESLDYVKDDAFFEMHSGDLLVGFALDKDPEYTDIYEFDTVAYENAPEGEKAYLLI